MTSIAYSPVNIQASAQSVPSTPCWFREVTLIAHFLTRQGVLAAIENQVRFARRRFENYEVIDFLAVLVGYAISGERTLEAFYEQLLPWASAFMALFGRERLPARSTLSRFLASLDQAAVEASPCERPCCTICWLAGWSRRNNRVGCGIAVAHIGSSSRSMARERQPANAPYHRHRIGRPPRGRLVSPVCSWLYRTQTGRSRPHAYHCVASPYPSVACHLWQPWQRTVPRGIAPRGGGDPDVLEGLRFSRRAHAPASGRTIWHGSCPGGSGWAVFCDARQRLSTARSCRGAGPSALPPDQQLSHPESGIVRTLYDCPDLPLGPTGKLCRIVVATHPTSERKSRVGVTRAGVVYELFFTHLPQQTFTAADVVALYLHRGDFAPAAS